MEVDVLFSITPETMTVQLALLVLSTTEVAVITASPGAFGVTAPSDTVATLSSLLFHVTAWSAALSGP